MRFTVDRADDGDLHRVFTLGKSLCGNNPPLHEWTESNLADILGDADGICFTAKERKKVLGFIVGRAGNGKDGRILFLAAAEHPLKQRVLEVLLESFSGWARERCTEKINFTVDRNNVNLLNFLSTLGFKEEKTLVELTLVQGPPAD